jgi:hypothetical protein
MVVRKLMLLSTVRNFNHLMPTRDGRPIVGYACCLGEQEIA